MIYVDENGNKSDKKILHRVITDPVGTIYDINYTHDLLLAAMIKGYFDIDGTGPLNADFCLMKGWLKGIIENETGYEHNGGFADIKMKDSNTFEGKYVSLDSIPMQNRVVICSALMLDVEAAGGLNQYLDICAMKPKLVIIPLSMSGHHRVLILQPQDRRAYYYDAFGNDLQKVRSWCVNSLGYNDYTHNDMHLQTDSTSCCPSVVNFALHAVECIKNNREITAKGMPKFGCSIFSSAAQKKTAHEMLEQQRNLLRFEDEQNEQVSFQTGFAENMYGDIFSSFVSNAIPQFGETREFAHLRMSCFHSKENKLVPNMLGIGFGGIIGVVLGYVIAQKTEISTVLTELLKVTSQQADIIFTVSTCIAMGAILSLIGNLFGRDIDAK